LGGHRPAQWLKDNPPPDLQELVDRAGRRYAASKRQQQPSRLKAPLW
jgi:hypothetical protein